MTKRFEILDPHEWIRLIVFAQELTQEAYNGYRLRNTLLAEGWDQFTAADYARACAVLEEHYKEKAHQSEMMGESEGFEIGLQLSRYSVQVLIDAANIAHAHRRSPKFLRGLSAGLGGYSASQMAKAAELWPEWFASDSPRASTVDECRTLFTLASLPKDQAQSAYLYWRDHFSLTFWEMYQYVQEIKAQNRLRDFGKYPAHRRETLRGLGRMKETAGDGKLEVIEKVIETVKERL
jgi:hypothetical protein